MSTWRSTFRPASFATPLGEGRVRCGLCPRHCVTRPGQLGFCGVRGNHEGALVSYNWGKSVHATEEMIETEAVYHYAPGSRILSMGNIGCMMNCSYCHNWKTSQARQVADADVHHYTPQEVVDRALRHGIRVLSWTYNDPVVWHEFVVETAALAKRHGLLNLYKSAFYISEQAIDELLPLIDIFSLSLKSMDPAYYRKLTKGELAPVLAGIKQVHRSGRHLEVSNLMITDLSDDEGTARTVARFVLDELDASVPLHFVRFHPDYKMTGSIRTPIPRLERARAVALEMGVQHVYLGNVYDHDATHTSCHACGARQVERYGMVARGVGLAGSRCAACGAESGIRGGVAEPRALDPAVPPPDVRLIEHRWQGDLRSLHVQVRNDDQVVRQVRHRPLGVTAGWNVVRLAPGESHRFILAKSSPDEAGVEVGVEPGIGSSLHDVFDRAHFPTVAREAGTLRGDIAPLPAFQP
jgi:pyruvate formate lyase activating enzyme